MKNVENKLDKEQQDVFYKFTLSLREKAINLLALVKESNESAYKEDYFSKNGLINLFDELVNFIKEGDFSSEFKLTENYDGILSLFYQVRESMLNSIKKQREMLEHLKETKDDISKILDNKEKEYVIIFNIIREGFSFRFEKEAKESEAI